MNIQTHDVRNLLPLQNNPRTITDEDITRLRESIQTFGLFRPLIVWKDGEGSHRVVGGNQRLKILQHMADSTELPMDVTLRSGVTMTVTTEVPCVEFLGTESEAKLVALRDNNSDGDWDWETLPGFVDGLVGEFSGLDLTALTGFDQETLDDLSSLANAFDVGLDDFHGEVEPQDESPDYEREGHRFQFGNLKGTVSVDGYERFVRMFTGVGDDEDTKDIGVILSRIVDIVGDFRGES